MHKTHVPAPGNAAVVDTMVADTAPTAATLASRVQALEAVVALERKLRHSQQKAAHELRQQLAQAQSALPAAASPPASASAPTSTHATASVATSVAAPAITSSTRASISLTSLGAIASGAFDPDATRIASAPAGQAQAYDEAQALPLPPGFMLHEYRIDSVLGQGGFGITYLALDVNLNLRFALKEYLPAAFALRAADYSVFPRFSEDHASYYGGLDSFLQEARTLANFRHPNIVRVARFFEAHHTAYIVLDYERGQSLRDWWPAHASMAESELLALLHPLLDGLAQVHASGYLHRDIKPDNIMLRETDGSMVLLDFGAARQSGGSEPMEVVLTPGYAPKEQYLGQAQGPWTDIYAFAATLYWMVGGHKPLPAPERGQQSMASAQELGAKLGPGRFSLDFLQAIDWALAPEPPDRPQNVSEFCTRLFAAHSANLGLQEALRRDEVEDEIAARRGRQLMHASLAGGQRLGHFLRQRLSQVFVFVMQPGSWPLGVKITLAMVLAALLPMTITAYYNLNGSIASVSKSELRNLERLAQATAGRTAQVLADSRHLADYLGLDADFIAWLRAPNPAGRALVEAKIKQLLSTNPDVHRVLLLDKEGTALISNDPAVTGSNSRFRQYFKEAMAGRSFTTGMVVSHIDGSVGVYYSRPVFDAAHQVVGVIVLRIKGATIATILNDGISGTGRVPFLLDGDGILIYHPQSRNQFRSLMPLTPTQAQAITQDRRFGGQAIQSLNMPSLAKAMVGAKNHGNLSYWSSLSGTEEHAGYAPVAGHEWVVGITEPREQFEAPLKHLFQNVLWSVVLVGILFVVLAWWFARSIIRPILRLTQAANALKEGDFDKATLAVGSNDEIGRLARTFNVMIDVLRQRERERGQRAQRAERAPAAPAPDP
jgi:serine/threonine protein kinase/HAMP domain-containing protein